MRKNKTNQPKQPNKTETSQRRNEGVKRNYGDVVERPTVKPPSFDSRPSN